MNNPAMPGLNTDNNDFFDFEAASSSALWAGTHDNFTPHRQTVENEEAIHTMPLTSSEIEAILAARASKAQNYHQAYYSAPQEFHSNYSGFEELGSFDSSMSYDGAGNRISTDLDDTDMVDYGNMQLETFAQPEFEDPAEAIGGLTDPTPKVANQSGFSLIQSTQQPKLKPKDREAIMQAWSAGHKCTWPECASKAVFKTKGAFNRHITNLHDKPLLCLVPNCSHKTPFGRISDLRRHVQSAHSIERQFICPIASCDARIKEFARKDHLTKHLRERHDSYFCPMNHCVHSTKSSFAKPENLAEHIKTAHGPYECAVKACARASSSKFSSRDSLEKHLINHHSMNGDAAFSVTYRMSNSSHSEEITAVDLYQYKYDECKICEKGSRMAK